MKLIIDIPDDVYNECKGDVYFPDTGGIVWEGVRNGIPLKQEPVLEKIREEIKSKKFGLTDTEDGSRRIQYDIHAGFDGGIECALQIIDKYSAEGSDKE